MTYSLEVIDAASRVSRIFLEGLDRCNAADMILLEDNGLMERSICEDADAQDSLEVGETMWTFNKQGDDLVHAIRGQAKETAGKDIQS